MNHIISQTKDIKLVGSLTSFPARINNVYLVIESIMRQTKKPDILVLWLSKQQFPNNESLPKSLINLEKRGLVIRLVDEDLRSHKKYYYALQEYPNADLFTFDDDIIYPSHTIESVINAAKRFPKCVVGRYCNHLKKDKCGNVVFDRQYTKQFVNVPLWSTFIGSGGGTLYPVGSLPKIATNKQEFMKICKTADDVWLNLMCRYAGYKVVAIQQKCPLLGVLNKNNPTLFEINHGTENQKQIAEVRQFCINNGNDPFNHLEQ